MSNFLKFIDEDIEAKKTLIATMPTRTKRDIKKYNARIAIIEKKYEEYKTRVKKYLDTKNKSFDIKQSDDNAEKLRDRVNTLEQVRFILNPSNTYLEKLRFDKLVFEISNYYDFNFSSLNDIINQFLDKFELAGIKLNENDFDYTCYVHEYMTSFLKVRNAKNGNYDDVSKMFESIYWINPEIIGHIELNFRKLIKAYEKKFVDYIKNLERDVKLENNIIDYEDCLSKLKEAYIEWDKADKESIHDIIDLAKTGNIDINYYFKDSKIRTSTYNSLMIKPLNLEDKTIMDKFYATLKKLSSNIEEYDNYMKFMPLIDDFKSEFTKQIQTDDKDSNREKAAKELKDIESQIADKEGKLEKTNKKIFSDRPWFFGAKNSEALKQLKIDSVKQAKELYDLYRLLDKAYFNDKVLSILSNSLMISELLHLYYSYDYFKKLTIKKVFETTTYDDVIKYSDNFDLFAMNPTNIITSGVAVFEESNLAKVIMNKYRLYNINLTEDILDPDDLKGLLDRINMILRIDKIEKSSTTIEKIWFMVQVEKINRAEKKTE